MTCRSCRFWVDLNLHDDDEDGWDIPRTGRCHRYPPVWVEDREDENLDDYLFPLVNEDEFCGEYKRRKRR